MVDNTVSVSRQCLRTCLDSLLPLFKITSLTENQFESVYSFICGREVFVSLPTGSGKSVIFHLIPLVHTWMFHNNSNSTQFKKDSIILIICPLLTLMQDQVKLLTDYGLKAVYIDGEQSEDTFQYIENGLFTYVFLSPESALSNERWRNMLSSEVYKDKLVGVIIDEVHCMTEWGLSSANDKKSAFRKWYSRINEAKSLTQVPLMALTATATKTTKGKIFELLEFTHPVEIIESPNKNNISYCVQVLDKNLTVAENFRCVIDEILRKGKNSIRTIIYCQTVKQCAILYKTFELELQESFYLDMHVNPVNRLVEMLHSGTPVNVKEHIAHQFSSNSSHLRVLIATIAYGMGVNCQGVTRIIHFGPSKSVQAYIQESGRCGRSGEKSTALLLYNGLTLRVADSNMKEYVKSDSCRRKLLLKHFDTQLPLDLPTGHNCCDICTLNCQCQGSYWDIDLHMPCMTEIFSSCANQRCRTVYEDQRKALTIELQLLQKKLVMKAVVGDENNAVIAVSYPNVILEFGQEQINQILNHVETIFTLNDLRENVDFWKKAHAIDVLQIFSGVFGDVELPIANIDDEESDDEFFNEDWVAIRNDPSFLELLGHSEWELESFSFTDEQDTLIE